MSQPRPPTGATTVGAGRATPGAGGRTELAWWPVLGIATAVTAGLLALANGYGFHRDELYFVVAGQHPDWGYVDQPSLTPLLSAAAVQLFGLSPLALRILPAVAVAAVVVLAAAIAREYGGGRRAQILAALAVTGSWALGLGHLGSTTTYDLLVWTVLSWLVIRLLAGGDPRWWLLAGVVTGIGLHNKHLVMLLAVGLLAGVVVARRWRVLRSGWLWAGAALALLLWLPNLLWQAAHGFPQLQMGGAIAERSSLADTLLVIPFQFVLAGPPLVPVLLAGLWWLLRRPQGRPWRPIAVAYLTILVITIGIRGQFYYPAGLFPALLAAGAVPLEAWLRVGARRLRAAVTAAALALSIAAMAVITLPVLPPATLAGTPLPAVYPESAEQIGWPELVATVAAVADQLPPADRDRAVILTRNYGEAGALTLLGPPGLPPVYSGHNSFADWGPPPAERDLVILVGHWPESTLADRFGRCERRATIDNRAGVPNQEQGAGVWVCPQLPRPWAQLWAEIRVLR